MAKAKPTPRTFDRRPFYDPRSLLHPIRPMLELAAAGRGPRSFSWRWVTLDQGEEGACTAFSVTTEAAARPSPVFGDPVTSPPVVGDLNAVAFDLYDRIRVIDGDPAEEGATVVSSAKAAAEKGWWTEYRWALGPGPEAAAMDVIMAIGYHGPVCIGSWWWTGMDEADEDGYLHPTGTKRGGHAFCLTRYSLSRDAVWTPNSWGGAGQGWIARDDLVELLGDDGEAMIPVTREHLRPRR